MPFLKKLKLLYVDWVLFCMYGKRHNKWFMKKIIYRIPFFKNVGISSVDEFDIVRYRHTDVGILSNNKTEIIFYSSFILKEIQLTHQEMLFDESKNLIKVAYFILTYLFNPKANKKSISNWFKDIDKLYDPIDYKCFIHPESISDVIDSDYEHLPSIKTNPLLIMTENDQSLHGINITVYNNGQVPRYRESVNLRLFIKNDVYYYYIHIGHNMTADDFYRTPFQFGDIMNYLKRNTSFEDIVKEFSSALIAVRNRSVDDYNQLLFSGELPSIEEKLVYDMIQYT